jgi:hypothetical protein
VFFPSKILNFLFLNLGKFALVARIGKFVYRFYAGMWKFWHLRLGIFGSEGCWLALSVTIGVGGIRIESWLV